MLAGVSVADPRNEAFLDAKTVKEFCERFDRFAFDAEDLRSQLTVARNLLRERGFLTVFDCHKYLASMGSAFSNVVKYFGLVLTIPVSNASCERSFSSLNRIKTNIRNSMSQSRTSDLAVISINRDLSNQLKLSPLSVVDEMAKAADRRVALAL